MSIGQGATLQIVCGAPNARAGIKAPLATIGAKLPNGIDIKKAALRGVESNGMLCSAKELGIDADASGLLELPADAPVGKPLAAISGPARRRIELKLTPNRPDCLACDGLATMSPRCSASRSRPSMNAVPATIATTRREMRLDAGADCPRYLSAASSKASMPRRTTPLWMAERLRRAGIRPSAPSSTSPST